MQRSFFDVTPVELGQLGSELAVAVLREMLWAEIHNIGIPISSTDIPFAVTTADGGVDAIVSATPRGEGSGLIFGPRTSYQVKAGNFGLSATTGTQIEKLLIRPEVIDRRKAAKVNLVSAVYEPGDISPRIKSCLDAGGTFVTLLFGTDNIDVPDNATESAIRNFLAKIDPKYAGAEVKVWRQSRICGLLRQFPAVCLQIKNLPNFPLRSHEQWSSQQEMRPKFVAAPEQKDSIDQLRAAIREDSDGLIHVRTIGEPGVGKTRLVLETLRANDLKSVTLYADRASHIDSSVISAIRGAKNRRMILVVDECGPDVRSQLMRDFDGLGGALTIISIYQDVEEADRTRDYRLFEVPPLPAHEVESIILSYNVDKDTARAWAPWCDGSPRVAHIVAQNLVYNPEDPLRTDGTTRVWVRYLAADVAQDSEAYRKRHLVLSSIALFKRFGWSDRVCHGANEIYEKIILPLNQGISLADFSNIVDHMRHRKVLQGDHYLYITPRAFHIKLWIDWWDQYARWIDMNGLVPALSEQMRQWFGEMIEYGAAAPVSKRLVEILLGPGGLYKDAEWLSSKEGSRFFFSLSTSDPEAAIGTLKRTIGQMNRDELLAFDDGRRNVIRALENIALHADLFLPSARLLLALADAETETWSNNATGVFADLFSLAYGELAPTGLAPAARLSILTDALAKGGNPAELALKGFNEALSIRRSARVRGNHASPLAKKAAAWQPKTYGEWYEAYKLYLKTLREWVPRLDDGLRAKALKILLSHMRELFNIEYLHLDLLDTLNELGAADDFDKREIIENIALILNYDRASLPFEMVRRLEGLRDRLVGDSFASRLRRYAGMDLLQDQYDKDGNPVDKTREDIMKLAKSAIDSPEQFSRELTWLVTSEAKNGFRFGNALSTTDRGELWPVIRNAWEAAGENAHDFFVGGYLRGVFESTPDKWQAMIDNLARTTKRAQLLPYLVWRSGMTEDVGSLLLELAQDGKIPPENFGVFGMGRASAPLSNDLFRSWLNYLMNSGKFTSVATAISLASMSLLAGRDLSVDIIHRLITHPALSGEEGRRAETMITHHWLQLSKMLIKLDPSEEIVVLQVLLENIGKSNAFTSQLGPEGERYLDELVSKHPEEAWAQLSEYVKPPMDTRGYIVTGWLRGDMGFHGRNPGPMRHIAPETIWKWVEADPERRASYIVNMAPRDFDPPSWKASLVREALCRFGDSEAVQSSVLSNFLTGAWSGPASAYYEAKKRALLQIKASEGDPNALRWLNNAIRVTEENVENAKIEEEARGY